MPFDVQNFKSTLDSVNGLMRNNKFLVQFAIPPKLASMVPNSGETLSMFCKAAPLPGIGLLTDDIYRYGYGPIERRVYGTVVNDIMFHFYVDGNNVVRRWFRNWVRMIINPDTSKGINGTYSLTGQSSYEIGYKEDYAVDVRVIAFTPEGVPKISITMTEAFPNYIGDIHQDWDDKNSNMLLPISLTFRDWYEDSIDNDTGSPSALNSALGVGVLSSDQPGLSQNTLANAAIPDFKIQSGTQFFNPNIDLDNSGTMPIGTQTPFGIRF